MTREELLKIPEKRRLNDVVTLREMTREEILSIAKPILFNTDMVRAILDGRKSVTRRIAFPNKDLREFNCTKYPKGWWYKGRVYENWNNLLHDLKREKFCKYQVGDILYVRETWCKLTDWQDEYPDDEEDMRVTYYRADYPDDMAKLATWHPSIHMPKEAARIFLRVTGVRVERLKDITDKEILQEGIYKSLNPYMDCYDYVYESDPKRWFSSQRHCFAYGLWDSTVKKSDLAIYGWDANPWVTANEFERVKVK